MIEPVEYLGIPNFTEEELSRIFKDLSEIENIDSFLKVILKQDLVLYFNVPPESQGLVRGGYNRVKWILDEIKKTRVTPKEALNRFNKKPKRVLK